MSPRGPLAVAEVRSGIEAGQPYDIVLVDLKMPDMDGIETTRALRRLVGANTLIIVMTAYEWQSVEEEARRAGVDFFIAKPLFRSELVQLFEKITNSADIGREQVIAKRDAQFTGERILLVEDNDLNLEVATSLLEMRGLAVGERRQWLTGFRKVRCRAYRIL